MHSFILKWKGKMKLWGFIHFLLLIQFGDPLRRTSDLFMCNQYRNHVNTKGFTNIFLQLNTIKSPMIWKAVQWYPWYYSKLSVCVIEVQCLSVWVALCYLFDPILFFIFLVFPISDLVMSTVYNASLSRQVLG